MRVQIIRNVAKCGACQDVIESVTVHDFVECSCGAIFVGGGKQYLRRGGDLDNFIDQSVIREKEGNSDG